MKQDAFFEANTLLPSQYFGTRRPRTAELDLMAAILQDALECVERYRDTKNSHDRLVFREARQWIVSNEPDWPFSFEWICEVLGLEADALRERLDLNAVDKHHCLVGTRP